MVLKTGSLILPSAVKVSKKYSYILFYTKTFKIILNARFVVVVIVML